MDARLNLFENPNAQKFGKYLNSAGRVVHESSLPPLTQELVKIRASQINGCGYCTYNRLNVITRQPAGDYQPGQWDSFAQ